MMRKFGPALSLVLTLTGATLAENQDTFQFSPRWTVGEKATFVLKLSMEAPQLGSIDISLDRTETALKVYENGDADVESVVSNVKVLVNGVQVEAGQQGEQKSTQKVDRFGKKVGEKAGAQGGNPLDFLKFLNLADGRVWKVGEALPIQFREKGPPEVTGKGTGTLVSSEGGVAKFTASMEVTTEGKDKPAKVTFTSFYDVATGRLNKTEGTLSGLTSGPFPVDSVQVVVERKKA
ncbi:MAG: hypothetical protein HZC36_06135 [Armatimonadetes bacterium]|nr:hypothetical protein [Armatimonadota bacterium]